MHYHGICQVNAVIYAYSDIFYQTDENYGSMVLWTLSRTLVYSENNAIHTFFIRVKPCFNSDALGILDTSCDTADFLVD